MLAASQRFFAALRESHRVGVSATIYPPAGPPVVAEVVGGSLRADRDARVRRQGSVTVAFDLALDVEAVRHLPFGGYVEIRRGVFYPDGSKELLLVATMRVENVSWSRSGGTATLELADRMAQVQDEPFLTPYAPTGKLPATAAVDAVFEVFGSNIAYHVDAGGGSPLGGTVYEQDRAQAVNDLASSIGADAYFDSAGDFVLTPAPPDPSSVEPVWDFVTGDDGSLLDVTENLDRSAVRNGVAVRGVPDDLTLPPVFALAVDDDPSSPTRWGGPFGKVATISSTSSVQSQAQADSTARSLLNLRLGLARTLTLRGVPNPALEPDDVVLLGFPDGREERLRVNATSLALDPTGALELVVTGHYRPLTFERRRRRRAFTVYGGAAAWRELRDAEVVSA